jgi:hypothetical protein
MTAWHRRDVFKHRYAEGDVQTTADERVGQRAFPQVNARLVGLAGLEPAPSSLSAITRLPLCNPAFLQVMRDRKGRSNVL